MLDNLTPEAKQQAIRMLMAQQGGQANPANMNRMMQQLASNPQLAAQAANLFMSSQASMGDRAGSGTVGSRVDDLVSGMMARDGTAAPATAAPTVAPAAPGGGGGGGPARGGGGGGRAVHILDPIHRLPSKQKMTGMGTAARGGPDAVVGDIVNAPLPPRRPGTEPPPEAPPVVGEPSLLDKLLIALGIKGAAEGARRLRPVPQAPEGTLPPEPGGEPAARPMQGPRQPQGPVDAPQTVRQPQGPVDAPQTVRQPQGPQLPPAPQAVDPMTGLPMDASNDEAFRRGFGGDAPDESYKIPGAPPQEKERVRVPSGRSEEKPKVKVKSGRSVVEEETDEGGAAAKTSGAQKAETLKSKIKGKAVKPPKVFK